MAQKEEWNERYSQPGFAYGIEPNEFLKSQLNGQKGSLLLPGEGEGRNALWAASHGWDVTAFDFSEVAAEKSRKLFVKNGVDVNYVCSDIERFNTNDHFDVIAMIYLHLPSTIRSASFKKMITFLNPNGKIILEMYHPDQLGRFSGGPKNPDLFPTMDELISIFDPLTILSLTKEEIELNEGSLHQGSALVIRMVAHKTS